jgi:hypothetical protein
MLAMGKHVILTDYSAHTEYADETNAHLVKVDRLEDAHDGHWFRADDPAWAARPGRWAQPRRSPGRPARRAHAPHPQAEAGRRARTQPRRRRVDAAVHLGQHRLGNLVRPRLTPDNAAMKLYRRTEAFAGVPFHRIDHLAPPDLTYLLKTLLSHDKDNHT